MDRITLKEHSKLHQGFLGFTVLVTVVLLIIVAIQFYTIQSLRDTIETKVYVAVDGKYYAARPQIKTNRDEVDYELFAETFAYNMFSHDINSFEERLEIARPFIYDKGFKYILSTYASGSEGGWEQGMNNIKTLYKSRDARTYYTIDSVKVDMRQKNKVARIWGQQKAVFAVGNDVMVPLNMEIQVTESDKSNDNPFGLMIQKFNFLEK
jgi:hypothetical protein